MTAGGPPITPQGPAPTAGNYKASTLVVSPRPDELGFPLREDEFQILCEGEVSDARAGRDLCFGAFLGAAVGLAGVLASVDWGTIWGPDRRMPFLLGLQSS